MSIVIRAVLAALALTPLQSALGQQSSWPDKPVRIVVPFAAGGGADILARMLTPKLSDEFGKRFIVENRPGAGGSVGAEHVVKSSPDGYTFCLTPSSYVTSAALRQLPYDPVRGISPIARLVNFPVMLLVHPEVAAKDLKQFIELLRSKPGTVNFGSPGIGSSPHLISELFQQMTGTRMTHVPYKGDANTLADLVGGRIQVMFASRIATSAQIKAGKVRELAVSTAAPVPSMPGVTAIGEVVPGYSVRIWSGMFGPPAIPGDIVTRLNQSLGRIMQHPEVLERLRAIGIDSAHTSPEEFRNVIERDIAMWTRVVKTGNITLN